MQQRMRPAAAAAPDNNDYVPLTELDPDRTATSPVSSAHQQRRQQQHWWWSLPIGRRLPRRRTLAVAGALLFATLVFLATSLGMSLRGPSSSADASTSPPATEVVLSPPANPPPAAAVPTSTPADDSLWTTARVQALFGHDEAPIDNGDRIWTQILPPLLIERVPGTKGNTAAREHIVTILSRLGWAVELDSFTAQTPVGKVAFANVIATRHPRAKRQLVLAAHYDSMIHHDGPFIGATDSAAPCAMLLEAAHLLAPALAALPTDPALSVQLVFFDGEEAFVRWSDTDSTYGSRHLAARWEQENRLGSISALVLLDLLGAAHPTIYNLQSRTSALFARLATIERDMASLKLLETLVPPPGSDDAMVSPPSQRPPFFWPDIQNHPYLHAGVEDDHLPFMRRGVPIVHLIPVHFPDVWHTLKDDASVLDRATVVDWSRIMAVFVAERIGATPAAKAKLLQRQLRAETGKRKQQQGQRKKSPPPSASPAGAKRKAQ